MTFSEPLWLVLLIPVAALLWYRRPASSSLLALRVVLLALVVFALAGFSIQLPRRGGVVVIVADRSLSMPQTAAALQRELVRAVESARSRDARVAVVSFGSDARIEQPPAATQFADFQLSAGQDGSNLHDGIATALALVPRDVPGRILVISDGRATARDARAAALQAAARGVAIDYRVVERSTVADLAIARIEAPDTIAPGESFLVGAWIEAPAPQRARVELRRGESVVAAGEWDFATGSNRVIFRDRAPEGGTLAYSLHVAPADDDPVPENNRARFLVGVDGPKPLLVVSGAGASGFPRLLASGGLAVETTPPDWTLESLANYSAVVLENVPVSDVGTSAMASLAQWVSVAGGGLMVTGGTSSFASGGYFKTPLDPILPVSLELRREHRKLNMSIVIAMDRSGSMAMPAGNGRTKMDLANLSAAEVLSMMSSEDELGVVAVDSSAHIIADLQRVGETPDLRSRILRIESEGGGIFVFEALSTAADMLLGARSETKHIILLADAADAEEPGAYRELLAKAREANITVTVVGLGRPDDVDAGLLCDIAALGGGRVYFTEDANQLPRLFAQDTFIVARSTFVEAPTAVAATAGLHALTGRAMPAPPSIGGFNLTYLRDGATAAMITADDHRAPVIASWQAGAGRVLAYTGEVDGRFTGAIASWPETGNLLTSLARWTAGGSSALRGDVLVTQRIENGVARIDLQLDPERTTTALRDLPVVTTLAGAPGDAPSTTRTRMAWTSPDDLSIEVPLRAGVTYLSSVDAPGVGRVTLPPLVLPLSPELAPARAGEGRTLLERIARTTGGRERLRADDIWSDLPRFTRHVPLRMWLLIAAVILLLLEVAERRMQIIGGITIPALAPLRRATVRRPTTSPSAPSRLPDAPANVRSAAPPEPSAEPPPDALIDALRRAGDRAQRKM